MNQSVARDLEFYGRGEDLPPVFVRGRSDLACLGFAEIVDGVFAAGIKSDYVSHAEDATLFHVDGVGVLDGTVVGNPSDYAAAFRKSPLANWSSIRGCAAMYGTTSGAQEAWILSDPLGGAVIYHYHVEGTDMISTSMTSLVRVASSLGLPLNKSALWFAELLASEAGGFSATSSIEEIQALPPQSFAVITRGRVEVQTYENAIGAESNSLDSLFDRAVDEIRESAFAYGQIAGERTAHLSAGADSRLSAAALVCAGVDNQFNFYCASNSVTREFEIAAKVATHMNLRMTNHSGLRVAIAPSSAFESTSAVLLGSQGMKHYGPFKSTLSSSGVILTGLYGELFRSFYSRRFANDRLSGELMLKAIWNSRLTDQRTGILRTEVIHSATRSIDAAILNARELGIREDAVGDYLYGTVRNRFFGAHTQMETSRYVKQGTVLYSPAGFEYALRMPVADRSSGRLMYDLFKVFSERSLEIPFDSRKFGDSVTKAVDFPRQVQIENLKPVELVDAAVPPEKLHFGIVPTTKVTTAHLREGRKLGLPAWRVAYEPVAREMIDDFCRDHSDVAGKIFEVERLKKMVSRPLKRKSDIRLVTRLASYLPWLLG